MRVDLERLRGLYQGHLESKPSRGGKGCPSPDDLAAAFESSAPRRLKKRIIDHISDCSSCRQEFCILFEAQKAGSEPADQEVAPGPQPQEHRREGGRTGRRPFWQFASLLLGVGLVASSVWVLIHQSGLSEFRRSGEAGLALLAPSPNRPVMGPPVFQWESRSIAEYYVLEIFDEALSPVWTSPEVRESQLALPQEVRAGLLPGRSYFWMVTGFAGNTKILESRLDRFVLER